MTDVVKRIGRAIEGELTVLHPLVLVGNVLARLFPHYVANELRTGVLRLVGWQIGPGTSFAGAPQFSGIGKIRTRLSIGSGAWINVGCMFELNDVVTIGDRVAIGHEVMILTSTHKIGARDRRAGAMVTAPVTIGDGVWIGSRSVVLPGVDIGAGAVVSTGSVVTKDVPPNCVVAGAPATVVVKRLPG